MRNMESRAEIMNALHDAVVEFDRNRVQHTAQRALSEGTDAYDAIVNGLAAGIERVGEMYACGEYFLPELTMCADSFYAGLAILRPQVKQDAGWQAKGTAVIGTVEGDKHDIGKNLVKLLLEACGFQVYDLGADVCPERFLRESIRLDADLMCLSATMTTTSLGLRQVIDMLRVSNPKVKIMVGGYAVSGRDASHWGVDGYAPDAVSLRRVVMQLMGAPIPQNQSLKAASRSTNRPDSCLAGKEPPVSLNLFQASSN
jgi:methanogenic corrinoid protein MtbC1